MILQNPTKENYFNTYDLGCSAALITAGFELISLDKTNPRKVLFIFEQKEGLTEMVNDYFSGRFEISARTLFDNLKMLKNRIYSAYQKESQDRNKILDMQQKSYNTCLRKIDNLIEMMANAELSEEQFREKLKEKEQEKSRLKGLLDDTDNRTNKYIEFAQNAFTFARDARMKFETASPTVKAGILSTLGSNLVLKDRKLFVTLKNRYWP